MWIKRSVFIVATHSLYHQVLHTGQYSKQHLAKVVLHCLTSSQHFQWAEGLEQEDGGGWTKPYPGRCKTRGQGLLTLHSVISCRSCKIIGLGFFIVLVYDSSNILELFLLTNRVCFDIIPKITSSIQVRRQLLLRWFWWLDSLTHTHTHSHSHTVHIQMEWEPRENQFPSWKCDWVFQLCWEAPLLPDSGSRLFTLSCVCVCI